MQFGEAIGLQLELKKYFNDNVDEAKLLAFQLETLYRMLTFTITYY